MKGTASSGMGGFNVTIRLAPLPLEREGTALVGQRSNNPRMVEARWAAQALRPFASGGHIVELGEKAEEKVDETADY